jgi:hypothetical protein
MRTLIVTFQLAVLSLGAFGQSLPASAPASAPAKRGDLAERYVDALHGFSIQPPANCERNREPSTSRLVTWIHRDGKTGAVDFTLTVQQIIETKDKIDLRVYSVALADKLKTDHRMKVEAATVIAVADRQAIDIRGLSAAGLWQRQVWVQAEAGRFLVFVGSGPADSKAQVVSTVEAVLSTARFTDPEAYRAARKPNLDRGGKLLAELKPEQIKAAIRPQQWYMLVSGQDKVGFVLRNEALARQRDIDGYQVTVWTFLQRAKEQPQLAKQVLFAGFDSKMDRWKEQRQVGGGESGTDGYAEDGAVIGDAVICGIERNGRIDQVKRSLPDVPYLPRAAGHLLPRLVDLTKPAAYAFATYTTSANDFDMRTFAIVAPEKIEIGGKTIEAIRATDQVAADAEELSVWLDDKGDVLRMELASWLTLEASTKADVVKAYPQAEAIIKATEKWASQP